MASWRDSASQQAQDDLDGLVNTTLPLGHELLGKSGEFYPFGASLSLDGSMTFLMGHPGGDGDPMSDAVIDTLIQGLREDREKLRAVAICANVRLKDSDALRVDLEHQEGQAIRVIEPYKRKRFGRGFEYLPLQAGHPGDQKVWE